MHCNFSICCGKYWGTKHAYANSIQDPSVFHSVAWAMHRERCLSRNSLSFVNNFFINLQTPVESTFRVPSRPALVTERCAMSRANMYSYLRIEYDWRRKMKPKSLSNYLKLTRYAEPLFTSFIIFIFFHQTQ